MDPDFYIPGLDQLRKSATLRRFKRMGGVMLGINFPRCPVRAR
jgi:hypothetical protein